MRLLARLAAPLAVLGFALGCAPASSAAGLPPQGVYEGCAPGATAQTLAPCVARLDEIAAGGFRVVLNISGLYGSPEQVRAYAAAASQRGLKLIWPLHHPSLWRDANLSSTYPLMTAACGCTTAAALVPFMVSIVKPLAATWMYYVGDEVVFTEHDRMRAVSEMVRSADPSHKRLFVHYGDGVNLAPFADTADVLGSDQYPVGWLLGTAADQIAAATAGTARVAASAGKPMAMVLQAFSWGPLFKSLLERWPTPAEYQSMRDAAVANGNPQVILWWAYYIIKREAGAEGHWRDLVAGAMAGAPASTPVATPASTLTAAPADPAAPEPDAAPDTVEKLRIVALSARLMGKQLRVRFTLSARAKVLLVVKRAKLRVFSHTVSGSTRARDLVVRVRRATGAFRVTVVAGATKRSVWVRPVRAAVPALAPAAKR